MSQVVSGHAFSRAAKQPELAGFSRIIAAASQKMAAIRTSEGVR
jgi:hypothetical protein